LNSSKSQSPSSFTIHKKILTFLSINLKQSKLANKLNWNYNQDEIKWSR
jgi:hypothetical protein